MKKEIQDKTQNYSHTISADWICNKAIFKIFTEFFNVLYQNKKEQKKHKIEIIGLYEGGKFLQDIDLHSSYGVRRIFFYFENILLSATFDVYRDGQDVRHVLYISSREKTTIKATYIYKHLLSCALEKSELKGKFLTLNPEHLEWKIGELEKRSFNDIFLPEILINDLRLYEEVFKKNQEMLRYLFVGIPGTGKTEATLVLSNVLKMLGVTIIKTKIGDGFKENMELAEILAPSIVLLDDIDLMLGSRNSRSNSHHLSSFLDILDGTDKINKNVGIIATTNSSNLLDLAAQRPGRFDKIMLFDNIEKENVKNIILKSLKYNFGINGNSPITKKISNIEIVNLYHKSGVTGSHIYNSINLLLKKHNAFKENQDIDINWIQNEIKKEIDTIDKIRKHNEISDRFEKKRKTIGFEDDFEEEISKDSVLKGLITRETLEENRHHNKE